LQSYPGIQSPVHLYEIFRFMTHYLHEEINRHFLQLYHKEVKGLPNWDIIVEAIQLSKHEPIFENIKFTTQLYHVIEDLLKVVKHIWHTYEAVNESQQTVTIVRHEMFENKVGQIISRPILVKPQPEHWSLYTGKTPEDLNLYVKATEITKLEWHTADIVNDPANPNEVIDDWANTRIISERYRDAFYGAVDRKLPRISFERFIERLLKRQVTSENKFDSPAFDLKELYNILKIKGMPEYTSEIREAFDKKYVKVFLKDKSRLAEIQTVINNLTSVKNANITENKEVDLTVYPNKLYTAEDVQKELTETLAVIFASSPVDPIIKSDILKGVSEQAYRKILNLIYHFGKNLEKFAALRTKFDEEGYREYFLPYLNMMSESHTATGETFNKSGKTDILIQNQQGENVFIAECKVWGGEGDIHPAIDQLLGRYVNWRDEKLSLIIFNKTVKGFSEIIDKAISAVSSHKLCKKYAGKSKDSSASFIFQHPEDENKVIELELILFNCTT
jgi:hypothetical protein